ncbi:hypothetical protein SAMN05518672_103641 [Chitinophaga sp. CF118]|uniref:hypothetical protein n=1 Tax=Chitinophaga sp. CF118 TaxID=1884367 RepID=UPI0008EE4876|nr:hypothetical protein [Chitinophaga sp. CF118]SFD87625.1 hypothetical protein SAMN05518672_103641 [Chitinophaga sp. CF118]
MTITNVLTEEEIDAVIEEVSDKDFSAIERNKESFKFDWKRYRGKEVYKLRALKDNVILGVMCIVEYPTSSGIGAIEIDLLEVNSEDVGASKKMNKIGGCLIAYACREAFKRGYEGFIFLCPKTRLINHYESQYGMHHSPGGLKPEVGFMVSEGKNSYNLIRRYLDA